MRRKYGIVGAATAIVAGLAIQHTATAAVVSFSPAQTIAGVSDVNAAGVLYAYDLGTTTGVTVNGVAFTGWAPATLTTTPTVENGDLLSNASMSTTGPTTNAGAFQVAGNGGSSGAIGTINSNGTNESTSYYDLLNSEEFAVNGGNACTITLTLQNLTSGNQYQFEMWVNDSRDLAGTNGRFDTISGTNSPTLYFDTTETPNGVGQFVIGTFTADASTQAISIAGGSSGTAVLSPQIGAFELALVPEPASAALIVLGISALACRRRRPA